MTTAITMPHDIVITIRHDHCHHNAPWTMSSQGPRTLVITMIHYHFHHNAPWPLSSQCSMCPCYIILPQDTLNIYNASPEPLDHAPCLMTTLSTQCTMAPFITNAPWNHSFTMFPCPFHHKAPWALSSQCSMPLASKCSRTLVSS